MRNGAPLIKRSRVLLILRAESPIEETSKVRFDFMDVSPGDRSERHQWSKPGFTLGDSIASYFKLNPGGKGNLEVQASYQSENGEERRAGPIILPVSIMGE